MFFGTTVDELLGYERELSRDQIRRYYHALAARFAEEPFEAVMHESEEMVRQYYSCYPFLVQMCVLWMNHYMLSESVERQQEILLLISKICNHILTDCNDVEICKNVISIRAIADLQRGEPEKVIEALKGSMNPNHFTWNSALLTQAYMMTGNTSGAEQSVQASMYCNMQELLNGGVLMLMIYRQDRKRCAEIIRRMDKLVDTFEIARLNPNAAAGYYYQAAITLCIQEETEEVYERLETFAFLARRLLDEGVILHGDGFFNCLKEWFGELDLGEEGVRNRKLIVESTVQALGNPVFSILEDKERLARIKRIVQTGGNYA